jgi:hypothetical protein
MDAHVMRQKEFGIQFSGRLMLSINLLQAYAWIASRMEVATPKKFAGYLMTNEVVESSLRRNSISIVIRGGTRWWS